MAGPGAEEHPDPSASSGHRPIRGAEWIHSVRFLYRKWVVGPATILIAAATMMGLTWWAAQQDFSFSAISLPWLGVAAFALSIMPMVAAARWVLLLAHTVGIRASFFATFRAMLLVRFAGLFTFSIGADIAGRIAITMHQVERKRALAGSVIVDRCFDLVLVIILLPASALMLIGARGPLVLAAAIAASLTPALFYPLWRCAPDRLALPSLTPADYATVWGFTIGRWALLGTSTVAVARATGISEGIGELLLLTAVAQLTVAIALTPGGWGVIEASWIGLLVAVGVDTADAAAFALLQRVVQTVVFGVSAALALMLLRNVPFVATECDRDKGQGYDDQLAKRPLPS